MTTAYQLTLVPDEEQRGTETVLIAGANLLTPSVLDVRMSIAKGVFIARPTGIFQAIWDTAAARPTASNMATLLADFVDASYCAIYAQPTAIHRITNLTAITELARAAGITRNGLPPSNQMLTRFLHIIQFAQHNSSIVPQWSMTTLGAEPTAMAALLPQLDANQSACMTDDLEAIERLTRVRMQMALLTRMPEIAPTVGSRSPAPGDMEARLSVILRLMGLIGVAHYAPAQARIASLLAVLESPILAWARRYVIAVNKWNQLKGRVTSITADGPIIGGWETHSALLSGTTRVPHYRRELTAAVLPMGVYTELSAQFALISGLGGGLPVVGAPHYGGVEPDFARANSFSLGAIAPGTTLHPGLVPFHRTGATTTVARQWEAFLRGYAQTLFDSLVDEVSTWENDPLIARLLPIWRGSKVGGDAAVSITDDGPSGAMQAGPTRRASADALEMRGPLWTLPSIISVRPELMPVIAYEGQADEPVSTWSDITDRPLIPRRFGGFTTDIAAVTRFSAHQRSLRLVPDLRALAVGALTSGPSSRFDTRELPPIPVMVPRHMEFARYPLATLPLPFNELESPAYGRATPVPSTRAGLAVILGTIEETLQETLEARLPSGAMTSAAALAALEDIAVAIGGIGVLIAFGDTGAPSQIDHDRIGAALMAGHDPTYVATMPGVTAPISGATWAAPAWEEMWFARWGRPDVATRGSCFHGVDHPIELVPNRLYLWAFTYVPAGAVVTATTFGIIRGGLPPAVQLGGHPQHMAIPSSGTVVRAEGLGHVPGSDWRTTFAIALPAVTVRTHPIVMIGRLVGGPSTDPHGDTEPGRWVPEALDWLDIPYRGVKVPGAGDNPIAFAGNWGSKTVPTPSGTEAAPVSLVVPRVDSI